MLIYYNKHQRKLRPIILKRRFTMNFTSSFTRLRHITSFPLIEHPFTNAVESTTSYCKCIIDSSDGPVWENPTLNIRSRILLLVMQTKSRRCSHNFASLNLKFSLFLSVNSTLRKFNIFSQNIPCPSYSAPRATSSIWTPRKAVITSQYMYMRYVFDISPCYSCTVSRTLKRKAI